MAANLQSKSYGSRSEIFQRIKASGTGILQFANDWHGPAVLDPPIFMISWQDKPPGRAHMTFGVTLLTVDRKVVSERQRNDAMAS